MEALGYIFIYFFKGVLPWQGLKAKTKAQKYEKISEKKLSTPVDELCKATPGKFFCYYGSMYSPYRAYIKFSIDTESALTAVWVSQTWGQLVRKLL